jgi:WD40 repeat protein/serine/threonine protein kinase
MAIFNGALELRPEERAAYLEKACAGDAALRGRVEGLLQAHEQAGDFLETPPTGLDSAKSTGLSIPLAEKSGDKIGHYKLLQQIGEGGCGVVYMAEQEEPVRRRVALKVIKLGMDTKSVIARFEAERQTLALMDHPNIAKVLDAGATATGRSYFVMELIRGVKITEYCDENHLPTYDRLNLFIQVCQAIQHAHQKGIIHRDIKPSNILVTVNDGVPVPKVIDFGIAKATQGRLTDQTLFTAFEQFLGTPAYMSPEQAVMTSLDIDTRSDIYSLGVLLYELLTGKTPFEQKELLAAGLDEMRLTIREKEPPKPSTRLSAMANDELTTTASRRQIEAPRLIRTVRGDLDWIVMKALEKERDRRYETANGFARDIQRHLNDEPVVARRPSRAYRFQKLVRRNSLAFGAVAAVVLILALGVLVSTRQAIRAIRAERSERALLEAAEVLRAKEETQRQEAERAKEGESAARFLAEIQAYSSDVNLAQVALGANNLGRAQDLLKGHAPKPGRPDLRGWEWRYLWQLCRSDATYTLCERRYPIRSLSISGDGKLLAVAEHHGGNLSIWSLPERRLIACPAAGDGEVNAAFCPREPLLAYSFSEGSMSNTAVQYKIGFWSAQRSKLLSNEISLGGPCLGLSFSGDGTSLVALTGLPDRRLTVWRIPDARQIASYEDPDVVSGMVIPITLAVSSDGRTAAYKVRGSRIRLFDLTLGKERWTTPGAAEGWVVAAAISPDDKWLASGSGTGSSNSASIHLWDIASGKEIRTIKAHGEWISSLVFWPDGKTLASASADQTIRVWNLEGTAEAPQCRTLRGHRYEVWSLALLPKEQVLFSGCKDGSVCSWAAQGAQPSQPTLILPADAIAWHFGQTGESVLTVSSQGNVDEWSGTDMAQRRTLTHIPGSTSHVLFSEDGQSVAADLGNGKIWVWKMGSEKPSELNISGGGQVVPLKFLDKSAALVAYSSSDNTNHLWDLAAAKEVWSWQALEADQKLACSADGKCCIELAWNGPSSLLDLVHHHRAKAELDTREGFDVSFSPDNRILAVASGLGFARLWDSTPQQGMMALREAVTLRGFLLAAHSVAFSPDSKRLAIGCGGRQGIRIWDAQSRHELLTLEGSPSQQPLAGGTTFSPDGNSLGCLFVGGNIQIWRAPSQQEIESAHE